MGAYHTLELELHRPFTISKAEWDSVALERIREACDVAGRADIAAVVLQEGLAQVCLVTDYATLVRARVEVSVPKKRSTGASQHDKGMGRFLDAVLEAILAHVNFAVVKVLILASPGFVKDALFAHMMEAAARPGAAKGLQEHKAKIVLAHCSSGHKHALQEVLQQPAMQSRLSTTKYAREVEVLDRFYYTLATDAARAFYGYAFVVKAAERGAIDTLLVTDALFRSTDVAERKRYVQLVEQVREVGGKVLLFSTLHPSGEQLGHMTGVAALLQYPLPELEAEVQEDLERQAQAKLGKLGPRPGDEHVAEDGSGEPVFF
jgi:protein pelota